MAARDGRGEKKKRKDKKGLGLPNAADVASKYHYLEGERGFLGKGTFAEVRAATRKSDGLPVAVKIIDKKRVANHVRALKIEIAVHDYISGLQADSRGEDPEPHPGIVQLLDKYEDDTNVYLVMEMMAGGELLTRLVKDFPEGYDESQARSIIKSILMAVRYLHGQGIVHRDLKPENLLFRSQGNLELKIADFGLAQVYQPAQLFKTSCGSPNYVAPEILRASAGKGQGYTFAVDMWSVGCVSYVILCGFCPFVADQESVLFERILRGNFSFPSPTWDHLTDEARSFIEGCLTVDPSTRLTPQQALEHPWLLMEEKHLKGCPGTIMKALHQTIQLREGTKSRLKQMLEKEQLLQAGQPARGEDDDDDNTVSVAPAGMFADGVE